MQNIKSFLELIAAEWSNSECKEAVDVATLLKEVLETKPVDKEWDDPQGIRCSPPDLSNVSVNDCQGIGWILELLKYAVTKQLI